jgi:formylmethanofuran dehydrogenase subunit D
MSARRPAHRECRLACEDRLEIHPHDAEQRGIATATGCAASRSGDTTLRALITDRVAPGVVYTTFHHPDTQANVITTDFSDWATNCPEYKVTAVQVSPPTARPNGRSDYDEQARQSRRIAGKLEAAEYDDGLPPRPGTLSPDHPASQMTDSPLVGETTAPEGGARWTRTPPTVRNGVACRRRFARWCRKRCRSPFPMAADACGDDGDACRSSRISPSASA